MEPTASSEPEDFYGQESFLYKAPSPVKWERYYHCSVTVLLGQPPLIEAGRCVAGRLQWGWTQEPPSRKWGCMPVSLPCLPCVKILV